MFERPRSGERAVLVHIDLPSGGGGSGSPAEFRALVTSAGARPVATVRGARDAPDPRQFIGRGKLEELRARVLEHDAEVVIVDHALTPSQERNLERELGCRVLDRITLILDIFAQRASTFEGKLQVELAQLRHLATRLVRGWTHLERQRGGIGLRGPGEKQLETDRRLVAQRIASIERRLDGVRKRRELSRRARGKAGVPLAALVGYTNAGKSTLFNSLTGAGVPVEDRLFATLDPRLRRLDLSTGGRLIVADTVGFIRHLPHELVAAFRATLEETRRASLLLVVVDASDPERADKVRQVNDVLGQIGAADIAQIEVYNKIDACTRGAQGVLPRLERDERGSVRRVWVSARDGTGLELLGAAMCEHLRLASVLRRVRIPAHDGRLRAKLFELGTVVAERAAADGDWEMDVEIRPAALERLWQREALARERIEALPDDADGAQAQTTRVAGTLKAS